MRTYKRVCFVLVRALVASLAACAFLVSGCESGVAEINASLTTRGMEVLALDVFVDPKGNHFIIDTIPPQDFSGTTR